MGESAFQRQTAIERDPAVPGRYLGSMSDEWNAPVIPQGGIVAALALRAMEAELAIPEQRLRSVSVAFAAQVRPGPIEVDVQVLRRGRAVSQVTATVRTPGDDAGHTLLAVYGGTRPGYSFTDLTPPDVPPPDECGSYRDPPPPDFERREWGPNIWDHVECRPAVGHPPWDDYEPASSERIYWYRFDEHPVVDDGRLDPLALVVLADTMPGAAYERIGPRSRDYMSFTPSADLTVQLLGDARPGWLIGRNQARFAGDGYASVDMELWDGRNLVAYATQLMFFSFPEGPPPPEVLRVD